MKKFLSVFMINCSLLVFCVTPVMADVQEEIMIMKKEARETSRNFEPEHAKCFIEHYEKSIEDKEFQRRLGQCLEVEADSSNSLTHAGELAQCITLRLSTLRKSIEAGSACQTPYQKKLDW